MFPVSQTQNVAIGLIFCYFISRKLNSRSRAFLSIKLTRAPGLAALWTLLTRAYRPFFKRCAERLRLKKAILPWTGVHPGNSCRTFCLPTFVTWIYKDLTKNCPIQYKERIKFIAVIRVMLIFWPARWRVIKATLVNSIEQSLAERRASRTRCSKIQHKADNELGLA